MAAEAGSSDLPPVSEETRRKVEAAKSYIENMYRNQQQNIQERLARWVTQLAPA
jgi:serine/threonine kinase 38